MAAKKLILYWTYTPHDEPVRLDKLERHQTRKEKNTDSFILGGLGFKKPLFTRIVKQDGRLLILKEETDTIHLAVEGGVNSDLRPVYSLNFHKDQYRALYNELRSILHTIPGIKMDINHFENTPIEQWLEINYKS